jgi:hypothetical protein
MIAVQLIGGSTSRNSGQPIRAVQGLLVNGWRFQLQPIRSRVSTSVGFALLRRSRMSKILRVVRPFALR